MVCEHQRPCLGEGEKKEEKKQKTKRQSLLVGGEIKGDKRGFSLGFNSSMYTQPRGRIGPRLVLDRF